MQCGPRFPPQGRDVDVGEGVGEEPVGPAEIPAPPQLPVAGHAMVGVQVDPVGQPAWPAVQGIWVMGFCVVIHRPPQADVCVQNEPPGQSLAPTRQVCVGTGSGVVSMGGAVAM